MTKASQYDQTPVAQLLHDLGMGTIPMDQRVVRSILARPQEAGPAIVAYGMNPPEEARLEMDADLMNLLALLPDADSLPYVVKLLEEGLADVPASMFAVLRPKGKAAVDALIDVYSKLDEEVSGEVAFLLAGLGIRDERIVPILSARLEFDMEDAAISIGTYGDPAALPALEEALAEVGKNRELEFAIEQLKNPPPEAIVEGEFDLSEEYVEAGLPEFDVLTDEEILQVALESEDLPARLEALDILEDLDLMETAVEPLLGLAKSDAPEVVRAAALRALHRAKDVPEVSQYAEHVLGDPAQPSRVRVAGLIALLPQYPFAKTKQWIEEFLAHPESRADAIQAMWRSQEPHYEAAFAAWLKDEDIEVKRQAVRGAGVMGDVGAVGQLRELLRDETLRQDAIFAYSMALPSEVTPARMRSLYKKIELDAGGLNQNEAASVGMALDMRLETAGKAPIFFVAEEDQNIEQ